MPATTNKELEEQKTEKALTSVKQAEANVSSSYENYVESVESTKDSWKNMKSQLKEVKQAAQQADAETAAQKATMQGVVSVTDALKLMEQEKVANAKYDQAAAQFMSETASGFAKTVTNGVKYVGQAATDMGQGIMDTIGSKSGAGMLLTGAAMTFLPDALQGSVAKTVEGWVRLSDKNEIDPGVEEKYVEGYDPDNLATSVLEDNIGDTPGYNDNNSGVGPDTDEDKQFVADNDYKPPEQDDATNISSRELDEMSDLDELTGSYSDKFEIGEESLTDSVGTIAKAVAEGEIDGNVVKAAVNVVDKFIGDDDKEAASPEDNSVDDDFEFDGP